MNLQHIKQRFEIIGRSAKLDSALATAVRVAPTELTVLITGESGVGKEVFSKIIHALSPRKHNNFIAVNCGAIPAGTINSELFGHDKGAFTGASSDRKGYFETVDKGTIFLDEIGEMPLDTQAFLLRVLESGEFIRVGSSKVQKTDVRIVAATNINLLDRVKSYKFREDLYYRLNTVPIAVPSLRNRREDIYMLFRKFAVDFADKYRTNPIQLDEQSRNLLEGYSWPGNIRELKNIAEQLSVLSEDHLITAKELTTIMPSIADRNLPAVRHAPSGENLQEREILYKLLFEMKNDLNDLKGLVFDLISNNDLNVPKVSAMDPLSKDDLSRHNLMEQYIRHERNANDPDIDETVAPIILDKDKQLEYETMEVVEENLSIENMEKDLIEKALDKHNGRRKDAAKDLGISERTLYRKIKQYELG